MVRLFEVFGYLGSGAGGFCLWCLLLEGLADLLHLNFVQILLLPRLLLYLLRTRHPIYHLLDLLFILLIWLLLIRHFFL